MKHFLRLLPPVHELQKDKRFSIVQQKYNLDTNVLTEMLQEKMQLVRDSLLRNEWSEQEPTKEKFTDELFLLIEADASSYGDYYLKKVINATGTILHTNLGRARLSEEAIEHVSTIAKYYSNLEYRIEEGERGSRHDIIEGIIAKVTNAEAAMVVNNNAAAVYLILRALAKDAEVVVSRGQLVEIGGSFRVSSIMEESGAKLVEVGTTNKTHLYDYENAINDQTKMIMKVHTSNFKTIGFTKSVSTEELVDLSRNHEDVVYYEDLGSGVLFDFKKYGIGDEPVVSDVIKLGADIVSFSGDKLLGGPQAGIIVGKKSLIQKLKKHQLARVLRVDKLTFAALEATLIAYQKGTNSILNLPVIRDMLIKPEEIRIKALGFIDKLTDTTYKSFLEEDVSQVGGGTMPEVELPTYIVSVQHKTKNAETLSKDLRISTPSIVTRIKNDKVIFDFRTIQDDEMLDIVIALKQIN
ncbi:L-seryl-tRNA(Sec) selenium transferase [Bacillus salitolerans]|uniref:L-seryl-tRNA(Sec) selenium transferase n=1 Tax=Bacillus salitolerans TaxID=1437434 RepID=A0ABW4LMF6_9BACI